MSIKSSQTLVEEALKKIETLNDRRLTRLQKGEKLIEWPENRTTRLRSKIYGYHSVTGEYREWNSQADCAEDLEGNRKNNNGVKNIMCLISS